MPVHPSTQACQYADLELFERWHEGQEPDRTGGIGAEEELEQWGRTADQRHGNCVHTCRA